MGKNILVMLLILITSSFNTFAWYNVSVLNNNNKSIYFIDYQNGFVVDALGGIYKTTNGGNNWFQKTSGVTTALNSVYFLNTNVGFVVGNSGKILKTTDGGNNWTILNSGTTKFLNSVYFTDIQTGYVVGYSGTILKTSDGGTTWNQISSGTSNQLKSVYFINNNDGFAVGFGGVLLKTNDAGQTWIAVNSGTTNNLTSIHFANNIGYIGGLGSLLKTTDSGISWTLLDFSPTQNITSLFFTNTLTGYAAVYNGIIKTSDGGLSWRYQSFYENGVATVFFVNQQLGFALCNNKIYKTTSGGGFYDNENLSVNNIDAKIYCNNFLFWERNTLLPSFEVPKGSGKHSNFASSIWLGGIDVNGQLRVAAHRNGSGEDYFPGPIMDPVSYSQDLEKWKRVWKISKNQIEYHREHWQDAGYIIPTIIQEWPSNGDTSKGQLKTIAPFVDENNDGLYTPEFGDYPDIMGDEALFFVFNDYVGTHTESNGSKLGVEVHAMAYAFNCNIDSALWNTIFINYKIISRVYYRLDKFYTGIFSDLDIGDASDDYIECDVSRSSFFGFNGDGVDGDGNGKSYGLNPPAQAITILGGPFLDRDTSDFGSSGLENGCDESTNGLGFNEGIVDNERYGMTNFTYFLNNDNSSIGDPAYSTQYYYYQRGYWKDGTRLTYGGNGNNAGVGTPAYFTFPGDPTTDSCGLGTGGVVQPGWSIQGNPMKDYSGIASSGPVTMDKDSIISFDIAFVFGRDFNNPDPLAGVAIMKQRIDSVKKYFITGQTPCGTFNIGIKENRIETNSVSIFPNPTNDYFNFKINNYPRSSLVKIFTFDGKFIREEKFEGNEGKVDVQKLTSGLYLIELITEKDRFVRKLIITGN